MIHYPHPIRILSASILHQRCIGWLILKFFVKLFFKKVCRRRPPRQGLSERGDDYFSKLNLAKTNSLIERSEINLGLVKK